jgi:hypothetical protein
MQIVVTITTSDGKQYGLQHTHEGALSEDLGKLLCGHLGKRILATLYEHGELLLDSPRHGDSSPPNRAADRARR